MKKNMGSADRLLRIAAALVIAILFSTGYISGTLGAMLMVFVLIFLATAFSSVCPLYSLFNLSTKKDKIK